MSNAVTFLFKQQLIFGVELRYPSLVKHCFTVVRFVNANRLTFIITGFGAR